MKAIRRKCKIRTKASIEAQSKFPDFHKQICQTEEHIIPDLFLKSVFVRFFMRIHGLYSI